MLPGPDSGLCPGSGKTPGVLWFLAVTFPKEASLKRYKIASIAFIASIDILQADNVIFAQIGA